jgi:C4-type Zn-finger protein
MGVTDLHIHQASVNNNCPNCYFAGGLRFDFYQKEKETPFFRKVAREITSTLHCSNCHSRIFPVKWSEDIERVEAYHRKLAKNKVPGIYLKPAGYFLAFTTAVSLIVILAYLLF